MGAGVSLARSILEDGQPLEVQQPLEALLLEMERRWHSKDDAPDHNGESLKRKDENNEARSDENICNDDPILQSIHKIFLSHSGYQKDFVEELCRDLERRYHFPFFDRRPSSLPKGARFAELILEGARQCQMAIVVVSEEYFVSKWPMIELNTFVQTRIMQEEQKLATKLKILPLFYGLSLSEFGNEKRRATWYSKWKNLAKDDPRIDTKKWKESLRVLASFNGIEYYPDTKAVQAYREDIVSNICNEVPSDIKWDDYHVQGGSNLCQAIQNITSKIQPSIQYGVNLIGIYGVGGIGKTTLCKSLCNKLFQEFQGKVSHAELGSQSFEVSLKKVLKDLTNVSQDFLQQLDVSQCRIVLRNNMHKQKTFLAIDNVWPEIESIDQAKKLLIAGFHKNSAVMVTSRSLETLLCLGLNPSHCFEMPSLEYEDAKNLFLHHAAYGIEFLNSNDKCIIEKCVALCYFFKSDTRHGHYLRKEATREEQLIHATYSEGRSAVGHYLPLALKALGVQLSYVGNKPSKWLEVLSKVQDFNYLQEEHNPVFSILRISFDRLRPIDQNLFMDLVLYTPSELENRISFSKGLDLMEWLSLVYNQDIQEIKERVQRLKGRGLLEDVDETSQKVYVHHLYRELAKLEATGKLNCNSTDFKERKWLYYKDTYPTELELTPSRTCWPKLTRIAVKEQWRWQQLVQSLQGVEWRYFSNVVVLKLDGLRELRGDLNLKGLKCLRSLELIDIIALDRLDGLQDLNNLSYFRWVSRRDTFGVFKTSVRTRAGQLPSSLRVLQVATGAVFPLDMFVRCTKLRELKLSGCLTDHLDLSACTSLQSITLSQLELLKTVSVLTAESTSSLQSLIVYGCFDLVEIPGLGNMVGLQLLQLRNNYKLRELPDLHKLTRLQGLKISDSKFEEVPGLGALQQLRELIWTSSYSTLFRSIKLPNLSGLKQLEVVDFSSNYELSSLEGVGIGDLPTLRCLDLGDCWSLRRLPNMSRSRNLKELDIRGSGIELGEEEICILASLPLLRPVVKDSYTGPKMLMPSIPHDDGTYDWNKWVRACPWLRQSP